MENPLDEQISEGAIKPSFWISIIKSFGIYLILLTIAFLVYYITLESLPLHFRQYNLDLFILFLFMFIAGVPGYVLQKKLYFLLDNSVIKTTLAPVVFWGSIIISSFVASSINTPTNFSNFFTTLGLLIIILAWLTNLSLIISFFIKNKNTKILLISGLAHFLFFAVILNFYMHQILD